MNKHTIIFLDDQPRSIESERQILQETFGVETWLFRSAGTMVTFLLDNRPYLGARHYGVVLDWYRDWEGGLTFADQYKKSFDSNKFAFLRSFPHIIITGFFSPEMETTAADYFGARVLKKEKRGGSAAENARRIWEAYETQLAEEKAQQDGIHGFLITCRAALPILRGLIERVVQDVEAHRPGTVATFKANSKKYEKLEAKMWSLCRREKISWTAALARIDDGVRGRIVCYDPQGMQAVADILTAIRLPSFRYEGEPHPPNKRKSAYYARNVVFSLDVPRLYPNGAPYHTNAEIQVMTELHEIWAEASHECYDAREFLLHDPRVNDALKERIRTADELFNEQAEFVKKSDYSGLDARHQWLELRQELKAKKLLPADSRDHASGI